jgi:hypothetical protein
MTTTLLRTDTSEARALNAEALADRFYELLALPTDALDREIARLVEAEHPLPESLRYEATLARLRAWLALDPEEARIVAQSWDRAIAVLPTEYRARRVESERAVLLNALTCDEFRRLAALLQWLDQEALVLAGGAG